MKKIILVVLCLMAVSPNVFALEEKTMDGKVVHYSDSPKLIDNFVEDVLSLLPPDMNRALEPHRKTLLKEARFNVRGDYWQRKVIGRNDFKESLESIPIKDGNELAMQLGASVEPIFGIALHPNGDDLMGDGLKRNLKDAIRWWKTGEYVVNYLGYKGQSVDAILASLYEMKKYSKTNLYPELVTTTADLWSAIWQKGGGKTQLVVKTFVRKPTDLQFRKK